MSFDLDAARVRQLLDELGRPGTRPSGLVALATVLQVDPAEAVELTLKAYGADALEAVTTWEDVKYDAQALITEHPPD